MLLNFVLIHGDSLTVIVTAKGGGKTWENVESNKLGPSCPGAATELIQITN